MSEGRVAPPNDAGGYPVDTYRQATDWGRQPAGARKDDAEKPPLQLVHPDFLAGVARASMHVERAAAAESTIFDAVMANLLAWYAGENVDADSGCPHLALAAACVMDLYVVDRLCPGEPVTRGTTPFYRLDADFVLDVARVLRHGARKYGEWNWLRCPKQWGRDYAAALRHLLAWRVGQNLDEESGLPHLAHAATCVMIVHVCQRRGVGEDDRPVSTSSSDSAPLRLYCTRCGGPIDGMAVGDGDGQGRRFRHESCADSPRAGR